MVNEDLRKYCTEHILPQYNTYDKGHNIEHVEEVVAEALALAQRFEVDVDMVYAAAVYHDLGVVEGRDTHHITSARMFREDRFVNSVFTASQMELIAEAIEDHRASSKSAPRSIYGEILSSADRVIDPETIIKRTYYYGLKHYAEATMEQQLERIYSHVQDKYGEGGYLQIPILTKKNEQGLAKLREMAADKEAFLKRCTEIVENLTPIKKDLSVN